MGFLVNERFINIPAQVKLRKFINFIAASQTTVAAPAPVLATGINLKLNKISNIKCFGHVIISLLGYLQYCESASFIMRIRIQDP